ncbi:hypothetical protein D3C77_696650 [compost metagenome]
MPPLSDYALPALCGPFRTRHQELKGVEPGSECLTRFLVGISVPLFTALKAKGIAGFAALEHYPYAQVREWVEGLPWEQP